MAWMNSNWEHRSCLRMSFRRLMPYTMYFKTAIRFDPVWFEIKKHSVSLCIVNAQDKEICIFSNQRSGVCDMRYNIFSKKVVSSSSFVTPERLPPTASATKLHCRRVYYQIMVWMGMDAMNWRWKLLDNRFVPLMSRMNAAPDSLAVTVPLPARPSAAHVEDMDCHVLLSVDRANLKNMTIHMTSSFQRSQMMRMNSD